MIEHKQIDTVITKDLSRLGRDYIQTGYYLEHYFPLHNIRYIAVSDGIDTGAKHPTDDLSPLRAVFNDMYAKDISKKVRAALTAKKKNGQFIGSRAPYGYRKDPQNHNRLLLDAPAAAVVRRIFHEFISGLSLAEICDGLTGEKIDAPAVYAGYGHNTAWNIGTVRRIVSNPTYAGHLCQNRSRKISYKLQKKTELPPSEWIITSNTHAPVVSWSVFECARKRLEQTGYQKQKRGGSTHNLSGYVFCADCGKPMTFVQESEKRCYLVCSGWKRPKEKRTCARSHCIREDAVERAVTDGVRRCLDTVSMGKLAQLCKQKEAEGEGSVIQNETGKNIRKCRDVALQLYKDRAEGKISEESFGALLSSLEAERKIYENERERQLKASADKLQKRAERLLHCNDDTLPLLLRILIDTIEIGSEKDIKIRFTCKSPYV